MIQPLKVGHQQQHCHTRKTHHQQTRPAQGTNASTNQDQTTNTTISKDHWAHNSEGTMHLCHFRGL